MRLSGCLVMFTLSLLSLVPAQAASVTGSVSFTGGVFSDWNISFTSSDPTVRLSSVLIQLPPRMFFDTTSAAPGSLTWLDFTPVQATAAATGFVSATPSAAAARNGATTLALTFNSFYSMNGPFRFGIDVDQTVTYAGCPAGILGIPCRLSRDTAASLVDSSEMAGTQIWLTFQMAGNDPEVLTGVLLGTGVLSASAEFEGTVMPEPASFVLIGSALLVLPFLRKRRA